MKPLNKEFDVSYNPDLIDVHVRQAREIRAQFLKRYADLMVAAVKVKFRKSVLLIAQVSRQTVDGTYRAIDPVTTDKPGKESYS